MKEPVSGHPLLPAWFDPSHPPVNDDLAVRVVMAATAAAWRPSRNAGLEMRVLEHIGGETPRLTAQLRLGADVPSASLGGGADLEVLVQRGEIEAGAAVWPARLYVRLPARGEESFEELLLHGVDGDGQEARLYVSCGHIPASDAELRRIDTADASRWLPGPVEGTEVMPLHGHGTGNVMLIRWLGAVAFRPRLDPLGEEVLVLRGCLHDADGDYPADCWIRNPVPAWQSWAGDPGTVVYYKSGHFAIPPDGDSLPFPTNLAATDEDAARDDSGRDDAA